MSEWVAYDGTIRPTSGKCIVKLRDGIINSFPRYCYKWDWNINHEYTDIVEYCMVEESETKKTVNITAPELLQEASSIMEERGKQYDQEGGERSMSKTVDMFNTATGRDLTEVEGWFFMECLKNVRFFQNTKVPHADSIKDKIAYSALFGEAALRDKS